MLTLHVVPVLGDIKLLELKSDHVEAMLDEMAEQNLAASSMRHALNLTRRVLRFAMLRDKVRIDSRWAHAGIPQGENSSHVQRQVARCFVQV